ncbi:MAG: hypothetical protein D6E12_06850 [Desulfovibrio sp.]|nr:MAG: hypothetical protein D6E12_06850 [Desulfovibrio sp.]
MERAALLAKAIGQGIEGEMAGWTGDAASRAGWGRPSRFWGSMWATNKGLHDPRAGPCRGAIPIPGGQGGEVFFREQSQTKVVRGRKGNRLHGAVPGRGESSRR